MLGQVDEGPALTEELLFYWPHHHIAFAFCAVAQQHPSKKYQVAQS